MDFIIKQNKMLNEKLLWEIATLEKIKLDEIPIEFIVPDEDIESEYKPLEKNIYEGKYFFNENDGSSSINTQEIDDLFPTLSMSSIIIGNNSKLNKTQQYLYFSCTDYKEKILQKHKNLLTKVSILCKIPEFIVLDTLYKLRTYYKTSAVFRGKNYLGMIAVALYYEAKKHIHINARHLVEFFGIDIKTFGMCCRIYSMELDNTTNQKIDILTSILNDLQINQKFVKLIKNILKALKDLHLDKGFTIYNNISGVILMISNKFSLNITQDTIKETTKTGIPTMKKIEKFYLKNEVLICNYMKYHM